MFGEIDRNGGSAGNFILSALFSFYPFGICAPAPSVGQDRLILTRAGNMIDPFGIWRSRTTEMVGNRAIPKHGNGAGKPFTRAGIGREPEPHPPSVGQDRLILTPRSETGEPSIRSGSGDPELQKWRGIGQSRMTEMARANHSPARASGASPNRTPHP